MAQFQFGTNALPSDSVFQLAPVTSGAPEGFWLLTLDMPGEKVNKLGRKTMADFEALIVKLEAKSLPVRALLLISGKPGQFVAGADIEMLQAVKSEEEGKALSRSGQKLLERWEDLPIVKVAAVDGAAMGGGCELALGCTGLVMSNSSSARIGLPEVMLGLIPGMGGCVRLPRKVGLATALDMILTGKTLNGDRAAKAGLADACLPKEDFTGSALSWMIRNFEALSKGERLAKEPKLGGMGGPVGAVLESAVGRGIVFKKAREGVLSKTHGHYPAPLEAISVLHDTSGSYGERLLGEARAHAMEREAAGFGKMTVSPVSKNLIRIFFLTEGVKKSKGITSGDLKSITTQAAGVLGAGVMGGGIAQLFAEKSILTRMKDLNTKALALGMQSAGKIFQKQVKTKRITKREFLQKMNFIGPTLDYSGFRSVDVVVEAVIEKMDIKKTVIKELEQNVKDTCVIASNTSSLSISEMQTVMTKPERFAGMHFFNPVHKMPLVEVIRGAKSSDLAVSTIYQFSKQLGKTPIVVKDAPGFLVNRLLAPYLNEAVYLLAEGVAIERIDAALLAFGMPMGPMELIDEVGVDVAEKVAHILHDAFGDRMQPAALNAKLIASGRLGKKNGKGLYTYEGREKKVESEVYSILGVSPGADRIRSLKDEEIVERCILPMINEAARCLEEKIVETPSEVDLGMIMGTGFPPFRGGLLRHADQVGTKTLVQQLKKYEKDLGARFKPSQALMKLAESNSTFHKS